MIASPQGPRQAVARAKLGHGPACVYTRAGLCRDRIAHLSGCLLPIQCMRIQVCPLGSTVTGYRRFDRGSS
jgi:hypothetical protein